MLVDDEHSDEVAQDILQHILRPLVGFLNWKFPSLSQDDAEDIAHDAFTKVVERASQFDPTRAQASTWLYGVAIKLTQDFFRKHGNQARFAEEWGGDEGEDRHLARHRHREDIRRTTARLYNSTALGSAEAEMVRAVLQELPEQQQKAAIAYFVDGYTPKQIDELYEWKPNTTNVYLNRARKVVRERLTQPTTKGTSDVETSSHPIPPPPSQGERVPAVATRRDRPE